MSSDGARLIFPLLDCLSASVFSSVEIQDFFILGNITFCCSLSFPGGSDGKRLSTMRETGVQSLGWEDLLEKEMATNCSTLAWKIPWMEEPGRPQSMGLQRVRHD